MSVASRPTGSTWKSALLALLTPSSIPVQQPEGAEAPATTQTDDEREAFHLDDLTLASRVRRDRGLVHYRTPPHARLVFPTLTGP